MLWCRLPRIRCSALLATTVVCCLAGTAVARGQTTPPGGTTPGGIIFDRLREDSARPTPQVPPSPPAPPRSDMIWVPDRHVALPGIDGRVWVPGHWERRISEHEVYVPPLTGHTDDGRTIQLPGGSRRGPDERVSP